MKTRFGIRIVALTVGLVLLSAWSARAAYDNTNYARFHDWQDMGCRLYPGGAGASASGADQAGGNQEHCTVCGGAGGRAAWTVDEPYLNLFVTDEPLSYTCSSGQTVSFRFLYRQRYTLPQPDECPNYYRPGGAYTPRSVGDPYMTYGLHGYGMTNACWGHNWLMDMEFWDEQWEENHTQPWWHLAPFAAGYEAWVWRPEGGVYYFQTNNNGQTLLQDGESRVKLQPLSLLGYPTANTAAPGADGIYWGEPATNGFRLLYPDGSQDVLSLCSAGLGAGATTARAFLTQRVDPQGRVTRVGYERYTFQGWPVFRVRCVVDPDGRTNTFVYPSTSPTQPWQVIEIDDPYGRKAQMGYVGGVLNSITDAAGLTSSFTYLSPSGWITNLTTPYGTTSFTCTETTGQTNGVGQRALLASEPNNAYQLYYYRHSSQTYVLGTTTNVPTIGGTFDTGSVGANLPQLYYRNSFYWDRRQTAAFPASFYTTLYLPRFGGLGAALTKLVTADYNRARLRHWLWGADGISITESLSSERDPTPDPAGGSEGARTWYDYAYKPSPEVAGYAQVGCIARRLLDNTTQYTRYTYWQVNPPWWDGLLKYNESSYTQPDGTVEARTNGYSYSNNGVDLLSITNSLGQRVNLAYNTLHQPTFVTNALNQVTGLTWDGLTANLRQVSLPSGQTMSFDYYDPAHPPGWPLTNTSSLLKTTTLQPQGLTIQISDYTNGLPRVVTTSGPGLPALTVTNFWDGLNRLTRTAFPDGTTTSNVYDRLYVGATKDRLGHWTSYSYDNLEYLTSITDARTNTTQFGWCGCGALDSITDATLTNTTWFYYNNQGLLTNILFPDTSRLIYTLDSLGRVVRAADGQAKALAYGYNNQGLLTTVSNAFGLVERIVYDAADRPFQVTDANNVTITNQFDMLNRLTNRFWADGIGEGFGWSTNGLVGYTNRNGKVTRFARDGAGRLTYLTNANLEVTHVGYNALNGVIDIWDGRTSHTGWTYNEYGQLISKVDALNHEVLRLTNDPNGQVINRWTPQFGNTGYTYDEVGNLKTISNALSSISYAYDALNRLKSMVDGSGTTTFGYTTAGQLQSEDGPWTSDTVTYGYNQQLRQTLTLAQPGGTNWTQTYDPDAAWRLQTLISPAGSFGYGYYVGQSVSPAPVVRTITLPNLGWITNHYDSLARLDYTALVNQWGHVLDGYGYGYDYLGLRTAITRDFGLTNSSVTVGYDSIGQITSWQAREGAAGPLRLNEQVAWIYDAAGNLRYRTNGGLIQTFTTDPVNQLGNVTRNTAMTVSGVTPAPASSVTVNGQAAQTYGDFTFARTNVTLSNGNNTFSIVAHSAAGTNATNNLTINLPSSVTLLYDSNGNLTNDGTRSFSYDAENRMVTNWVASAWKSEFVYDGLGRRRIERDYTGQGGNWTKTNETRYVYDGSLAIQERDSNNVARVTYTRGLDLSASLAGAGGIGGLLARSDGNGSTFYHADGAGNVTALMDGQQNMAARYMYGPFGRLAGKWGPIADVNVMQFSSMPVHHQSGLSLYPFRGYDPSLQRWLNPDPMGELGGINRYAFNFNNPLSYIDADGMAPQLVTVTGDLNGKPTGAGYADYNLANGPYQGGPGNPLVMLHPLNRELDRETQDLAHRIAGLFGYGNDPSVVADLKSQLDFVTMAGLPEMGEASELSQLGKLGKAGPKCEKVAKSGGEMTTLLHGSDSASVQSMVANGIDKEAARALGGGDVFWLTKDKDVAGLFAQSNLAGGPPAIAAFKIPTSTLNSLVESGAVEIDRTGAYMVRNWKKFNQAVIQRTAQ